MKQLFLYLVVIPLLAIASFGQYTTLAGTFQDPNGQAFLNGTYSISFVPVPGQVGPYLYNGTAISTGPFTGSLSSIGAISLASTVADNSLVSPSGSKWNITVCPNASTKCTSVVMAVTGGSMNVATTVNARIPVINVSSTIVWPRAYLDAEVTPVGDGAAYLNTTSGLPRAYFNGSWAAIGGGGSATSNCAPAGTEIGTQFCATTVISSAALKTLLATPISIVTAPGAGKMIVPETATIQYVAGATPYTINGGNPVVELGFARAGNYSMQGFAETGFFDQATSQVNVFVNNGIGGSYDSQTNFENLPLILFVSTGGSPDEMTLGNGTAYVTVTYYIATLH